MPDDAQQNKPTGLRRFAELNTTWYSPGDSRTFRIGDVDVVIRLVARKGRRARIAVARSKASRAVDDPPA